MRKNKLTELTFIFILILQIFSIKTYCQNGIQILGLESGNVEYSGMYDQTIVAFAPDATEGWDAKYDCSKLLNTDPRYPNLYTIYKDRSYAMNTLPAITNNLVIPLIIRVGITGKYYLKDFKYVNFDDNIKIFIIDSTEGKTYSFKTGECLYFNINEGEHLNRFYIRFNIPPISITGVDGISGDKEPFNICQNGNELKVNISDHGQDKGYISIFNPEGQLMINEMQLNRGFNKLEFKISPGIYILKLVSGNRQFVKKIFIQ